DEPGGDRKRGQLGPGDVDADRLGRDVLVAHRHEGPTESGPEQVPGGEHGDRGEDDEDPVPLELEHGPTAELERADRESLHVDIALAPGEEAPVVTTDEELDDLLAGQGGDGEVETLEPQSREAEEGADDGGEDDRDDDREGHRQAN